MKSKILNRLGEHREIIFQQWMQFMRQRGYVLYIPSTREEFDAAMDGILSILAFREKKPAFSTLLHAGEELPSPAKALLEQTWLHRSRGVRPGYILGSIKLMAYAVEDCILQMEYPEKAKLSELLSWRRAADSIETVLVEEWERSDKTETTQLLQQAYRSLVIDKKKYETIFKSTTDYVLIANPEGIVIEANPEATAFFAEQRIVGRPLSHLLDLPVPSPREVFQIFSDDKVHEITVNKSGSRYVFNMRILPMEPEAGHPGQALVLMNDVTHMVDQRLALERRATERALAQAAAEKILVAIFMAVGEGILLVDEDFEIVRANHRASEIFGLLEQNLIGTGIRSLTDAAGAKQLIRFFNDLIEGQRQSTELTGVYVDGRTFPATLTATRIDFNETRCWPIIVHDNSHRTSLENRLNEEKRQTEEMNLTLKNVMKSIENEQKDLENRVASKIRMTLLPALDKIDKAADASVRRSYIQLFREQLLSLTAGFKKELDPSLLRLSRTEIEVCRFIQVGRSTKEICEVMNLSFETIQTHRKNIRRKLSLNGEKVNLHAFLANRSL